ncbi:MAG: hypothetical protein WBV06_11735 [Acidimicrobiia bacterium]
MILKLAARYAEMNNVGGGNQEALAGLGNVCVDEILFQAGIHPRSDTTTLDDDLSQQLFETCMTWWTRRGTEPTRSASPTTG